MSSPQCLCPAANLWMSVWKPPANVGECGRGRDITLRRRHGDMWEWHRTRSSVLSDHVMYWLYLSIDQLFTINTDHRNAERKIKREAGSDGGRHQPNSILETRQCECEAEVVCVDELLHIFCKIYFFNVGFLVVTMIFKKIIIIMSSGFNQVLEISKNKVF